MSAHIGQACDYFDVFTSSAGVEVYSHDGVTMTPIEARKAAALLIRAADECERMRAGIALAPEVDALLRAVRDAELHQFNAGSCIAVVEAAKAVARSK